MHTLLTARCSDQICQKFHISTCFVWSAAMAVGTIFVSGYVCVFFVRRTTHAQRTHNCAFVRASNFFGRTTSPNDPIPLGWDPIRETMKFWNNDFFSKINNFWFYISYQCYHRVLWKSYHSLMRQCYASINCRPGLNTCPIFIIQRWFNKIFSYP